MGADAILSGDLDECFNHITRNFDDYLFDISESVAESRPDYIEGKTQIDVPDLQQALKNMTLQDMSNLIARILEWTQ